MGAQGLTAFVITLHVPALALAAAFGMLAFLIARLVAHRTAARGAGARSVVWGCAVVVVVYAVVCRLVGVPALGLEAIGGIAG